MAAGHRRLVCCQADVRGLAGPTLNRVLNNLTLLAFPDQHQAEIDVPYDSILIARSKVRWSLASKSRQQRRNTSLKGSGQQGSRPGESPCAGQKRFVSTPVDDYLDRIGGNPDLRNEVVLQVGGHSREAGGVSRGQTRSILQPPGTGDRVFRVFGDDNSPDPESPAPNATRLYSETW